MCVDEHISRKDWKLQTVDPNIYGNLVFEKGTTSNKWGKKKSFNA